MFTLCLSYWQTCKTYYHAFEGVIMLVPLILALCNMLSLLERFLGEILSREITNVRLKKILPTFLV